jgi:2-dehydropantoate 2-reductase
MKILVMGSGAVGGYYGAVLSKSGHEVTFVARGEHLAAIREHGLRVESVASGDFTIRPPVTERPVGSWGAELVLFCVKGYDNAEAIATLRPAVGENTSILTLQNGIGSGDQLGAAFGPERVLLGVTYIDAVRREPGVVADVGERCNIIFGEQDGRQTPRAQAIRDVMRGAGIDAALSSNVTRDLWEKLVHICALSGMICMTRSLMAEIVATPEARRLTCRVMREAEAVARARGVELGQNYVESMMAYFEQTREGTVSSMFTDLERGNRLEVGVLNGAVVRLGRELGIATPANEFITACLLVSHNRALSR